MTPLSTLLLKKLKPHPSCLSFLTWPIHQKVPSSPIPCLTNIIAPHWIQASSLLGLLRPPPQRNCPHFCSSSSPSATHQPDHVTSSLNPPDDVPLWPNSYPDLPGPMGSDPNLFLGPPLVLLPSWFLCFHHNGFLLISFTCQASPWLKVSIGQVFCLEHPSVAMDSSFHLNFVPKLPWLRGHPRWPWIKLFSSPWSLQHSIASSQQRPVLEMISPVCSFACLLFVCCALMVETVLFTGIPNT